MGCDGKWGMEEESLEKYVFKLEMGENMLYGY
jgi:hypothetical protein